MSGVPLLNSWPLSPLLTDCGRDITYMVASINGDTPIAGWFIMENPIKIDDLGYPSFKKPPYDTPYVLSFGTGASHRLVTSLCLVYAGVIFQIWIEFLSSISWNDHLQRFRPWFAPSPRAACNVAFHGQFHLIHPIAASPSTQVVDELQQVPAMAMACYGHLPWH